MNNPNTQFESFDSSSAVISIHSNMLKQEELMTFALEAFQDEGLNRLGKIIWDKGRGKIPIDKPENYREAWFTKGLYCEVLKPNSQGWQKGKVRIKVTLEFCPEELEMSESALDALR
ncbi:MAG: KGK domain-containing protein [Thermosynechococcaceae cyanobacterium]